MDSQPWLSSVQQRLAKHALPPSYVQRFVEELTDHLEDLKENEMNMEDNLVSRLGEPEQVAEAAVTAYRRRSFLGRHPAAAFLVFGISPVVSLIVPSIVFACLLGVTEFGFGINPFRAGIAGEVIVLLVSLLAITVPSILATIVYCKLGKRLGVGRKWILASCVTFTVFASSTGFWRAESGQHCLGLLWPGLWGLGGLVTLTQHLVSLIVPLAIGWWFMRRKSEQRPASPIRLAA